MWALIILVWFQTNRYINVAVAVSVQLQCSVAISAKGRTGCIITGLLLIYKYQSPPCCYSTPHLVTFCSRPHLFIFLPASPLFILSLPVVVWKSLPPPHFIPGCLRYVNNTWHMDLGYHQSCWSGRALMGLMLERGVIYILLPWPSYKSIEVIMVAVDSSAEEPCDQCIPSGWKACWERAGCKHYQYQITAKNWTHAPGLLSELCDMLFIE